MTNENTHLSDDISQDDVVVCQDPFVLKDGREKEKRRLSAALVPGFWRYSPVRRRPVAGTFRTGLLRTISDLFVTCCWDVW